MPIRGRDIEAGQISGSVLVHRIAIVLDHVNVHVLSDVERVVQVARQADDVLRLAFIISKIGLLSVKEHSFHVERPAHSGVATQVSSGLWVSDDDTAANERLT